MDEIRLEITFEKPEELSPTAQIAQDDSLIRQAAAEAERADFDLAAMTRLFDISIQSDSFKRRTNPANFTDEKKVLPEMLTASKSLIDRNAKAVKTIRTLDSQMKAWLRARSLRTRTLRGGLFRFPVALVEDVREKLEAYISEREALVNDLCANWGDLKNAARVKLRSEWHEEDYASAREIKDKFVVYARELSMQVSDDVAARIYAKERGRIESEATAAINEIRANLRAQIEGLFNDAAEMFRDNAAGGARKFHATLIPKLNELCEIFDGLNVTKDEEAAGYVKKVRQMIAGIDTSMVKKDNDKRRTLQQSFAAIVEEMKATGFAPNEERGFTKAGDDDF